MTMLRSWQAGENHEIAPSEGTETGSSGGISCRAPKPRVPALNMAASRLAGAALGAIGVAIPDTATAPHKPKAADKGPAKVPSSPSYPSMH